MVHSVIFPSYTIANKIPPGLMPIMGSPGALYEYLDPLSASSCTAALKDLEEKIETEGPFDAVMAYSEGAALAASLIISRITRARWLKSTQPAIFSPFKCAIFFSGKIPGDADAAERGEIRFRHQDTDGELIPIPTAHIWGGNDFVWPHDGPVLCGLCKRETRTVFIHNGGHEIPGSRDHEIPGSTDKVAVSKAIEAIRKTIELALSTQ